MSHATKHPRPALASRRQGAAHVGAADTAVAVSAEASALPLTSTTTPVPVRTTTLTMMARAAAHEPPLPPATVLFDVEPREIVFDEFSPGEHYTTTLKMQNRTKFTQYVRVARPDSHHFTLSAPTASSTALKVAPGLTVSFDVHFAPDENRDYACELPVITEEEQFLIPVRAYGSRGRLELPARFATVDCPVGGRVRSSLFVRNPTGVDCVWRAAVTSCAAGVFDVTPSTGTAPAQGAVLPVEVEFRPDGAATEYTAVVRFFLGPEGDMVQEMPVVGRAVELDVGLDCDRVELSDTYLTTEREAVVQLRNNSDHTVEFCWRPSLTASDDGDDVFSDEAFALSPVRGVLYGRGTKSFTVTFNPQMALSYLATAFLEVTGRRRRIPLQLVGRGLGPQCRLEFTRLNIGDVYLNAVHEYAVELSNVGCIEAHYTVVPPTAPAGHAFTFTPATGTLAPGATQVLTVRLRSELIGLLAEDFHVHLHGSAEELRLEFRGRVMGPTFQFDLAVLDFGLVSYDFWHERSFVLRNTSQTPMRYRLYLPPDSPYVDEFAIAPQEGLLGALCEESVLVRLRASTVGSYDTALLVDLVNVGTALDALPIRATCSVPQLRLGEEKLSYGRCFVGHSYTLCVHVTNVTTLSGKFELAMAESAARETAQVVIGDPAAGAAAVSRTIEPREEVQVPVTLCAVSTDAIAFTLQLRTFGSTEPVQTILVSAAGCGPVVEVQPSTIAFGDVAVLARVERALTLNNTSPIAAVYDVALQRSASPAVFALEPSHGTIDPYSTATVHVSACLDEEMTFSDVVGLRVRHQEGVTQSVTLRATGVGFAIVPDVDLGDYDVGDVFTDTAVTREVVLQNKGRRDQEVQWCNVRGTKVKEGSAPIVFTVRPERVILPARGGSVKFVIEGRTDRVGAFADEFVLKQTGTLREILRGRVRGNFIAPLLAYSMKVVQFDYVQDDSANATPPTLTRSLTMRNVTGKELLVALRVRERGSPFTLEGATRVALQSGESHVVGIRFDPAYRGDHVSHSLRHHLVVAFDNHPHTESVVVAAKLRFPALRLSGVEDGVVDFATVLTDTESRRTVTLHNDSDELPAQFEWQLRAPPDVAVPQPRLFDFVPFTGTIAPGASRVVEVVFYGLAGTHTRTAVCAVRGGAEHELILRGAAAQVQLHYSHTALDFGCMQYYDEATRYLTISNPSHVAVHFSVNVATLRHPGCVKVSPASGTLQDRVRLRITFSPTVPDDVVDRFYVNAGAFDPQPITVCGQGQVNTIAVLGTEPQVPCVRRVNSVPAHVPHDNDDDDNDTAATQMWAADVVPYPRRTKNMSSFCPVLDPIAMEAERVAFCDALTRWRRRRDVADGVVAVWQMRRSSTSAKGSSKLVLSTYEIDFGHMTRNEERTTAVRLLNTCPETLTLLLDSKELAKLPITVAPARLPKLSPTAETTLQITLHGDGGVAVRPGENRFSFVLDIKGGPAVVLECRCYVATPCLRLSESSLGFDRVVLGQIRVLPLTLTNEQAVPCGWRVTCRERSAGQDDAAVSASQRGQFWCNATSGSLAPHGSAVLQVCFAPLREGEATATLRFQFTNNGKDYDVKCRGAGRRLHVELSPTELRFPVLRPSQVAHAVVQVTNHESHAVELYSRNLDPQYQLELQMVERLLRDSPEQRLMLPRRDAGDYLSEAVLRRLYAQLDDEQRRVAAACGGVLGEDAVAHGTRTPSPVLLARVPPSRPTHRLNVVPAEDNAAPLGVISEADAAPSEPVGASPRGVLLLMGPPQSGKSTQRRRLCAELDAVALDLDAVVAAAAERGGAVGALVRDVVATRSASRTARARRDQTVWTPPANKPVAAAVAAQRAAFAAVFEPESVPATTTTAAAMPRPTEAEEAVVFAVVRQLLLHELRAMRRDRPEVNIVIVDDLTCALSENRVLLYRALRSACAEAALPLHLCCLDVSDAVAGLRRTTTRERWCAARVQEAAMTPLPEPTYEALCPAARELYNRQLQYYNQCRRELTATTRARTRYADAVATSSESQRTTDNTTTTTDVDWDALSAAERFERFYRVVVADDGAAAAGEDAGLVVVVDGAVPCAAVTATIVQRLRAPTAAMVERAATPTSSAVAGRASTAPSDAVAESLAESATVSPFGVWCYVDPARLARMRGTSLDAIRFLARVERDVAMLRKNAKTRVVMPVQAYEETTRWLLPPRSSAHLVVELCCATVGEGRWGCEFGLLGTQQTLSLSVEARIALPDLVRDEHAIFPLIRSRLTAGRQPCKVFVSSRKTYNFGPLLVPAPVTRRRRSEHPIADPTRGSAVRPTSAESTATTTVSAALSTTATETLRFSNAGVTAAEVTLSFGNEKERTFSVSPTRFTLAVGATQEVALTAAPETLGEVTNRLIACVKDNPTPWVVQVACTGSRPALTLDGKKEAELDFGRSTLHRTTTKSVTLVNVSCTAVFWRVHGLDRLPAELQLGETSGVLESNGALPLHVVFAPSKMGLHTVPLQLLVSDAVRTNLVYESLPLLLRAEAYDVVLEWTREVAFRLMHVGETRQETIRILNKGPYDVQYQIRVPRRLQGILTVTPQTGTIRGLVGHKDAAVATVDVSARFEREQEIPRKLGLLEVAFIDPERDELLYPLQTIPVTGEAWYTRFTVKPSSIDFGSCFFSQRKQAAVEVRNTGRFPVQFRLYNARDADGAATTPLTPNAEMEESTSTRRGGAGPRAARAEMDFRLGCFTVSPARGVVPVGEALTLTVVTVPERDSRTHEVLGLFVEQAEPALAQRGVLIELVAHPATPGITADLGAAADVETIFEEQQVVYRLDQFDKGVKAYGKEDRTFSFGTSLVGHRVEERFRIANSSPLPCTVLAQILPLTATKGAPPPDGFDLGADVEPGAVSTRLVLPPFESRFVTIGFTPSSLRRFDARLLAVVEDGTDARTNTLAFNLTGEGTLPSVEYVLPPRLMRTALTATAVVGDSTSTAAAGLTRSQRQKAKEQLRKTQSTLVAGSTSDAAALESVITMPLTLVGRQSTRGFVVRNVGRVPADVRVTLASDELFATGLTVAKRNTDLTIAVGAEETFEVGFAPTQTGRSFMHVRVDLADNPFETKEFNIEAEAYAQAISFDGLDPVSADTLTVDHCYVNEPRHVALQLRNNTATTLRFAWRLTPNGVLDCRPAVGHVAAGSTKALNLTLRARDASALQRIVSCEVHAHPIELVEPAAATWDDAAVVEKWVIADDAVVTAVDPELGRRNLRKVLESVPEPPHRVLDPASTLIQPLHVRYVCDVPSYELALLHPVTGAVQTVLATSYARAAAATEQHGVLFETTKMFQRRLVTLQLSNPGAVALPFAFQLSATAPSVDGGTGVAAEERAGVFALEPASGTVGPGEARLLTLAFAPVSAEAVSCVLRGEFAHSARPRLELPVSGTGECPLVHFQLPPSTYLQQRVDGEAGLLLDPDTLVVEMLTRSLHTRTTMRFKVINPTTTAYEFEWVDQSTRDGLSPFRCLTPAGSIAAGKKLDVAFEFSADTLGVRESLWRFCIPGKAVVSFLLVGRAVEPAVSLNASKIQFGHVHVGQHAEKVVLLENRDEVPFAFSFDRAEMAGAASFLTVKPLAGTIGAKERLPITIGFTPQDEMEYNVPLACYIKRASTPLKINVKGEGVCVHDTLHIESADPDAAPPVVATKGQLTHLNLGRVQVNDHVTRRFVLSNAGQHPFDLVVVAPERRFVTIDGGTATVLPRRRAVVSFTYRPTVEETLRGYKLQFKIGNKIHYQIGILAATYVPKLNLSAERIDFGPRFIVARGTSPHVTSATGSGAGAGAGEVTATLTLMNNDKELITVDCSVSEGNDWCEIDTQSFVAKPGESTEIHFSFSPREVRMYDDKLQLMLNGVHPMFVALSGEGVVPRVEVLNHFAKLGVARIGERREVEVRIECRSRIPTPLSFLGCLDEDLASKGISIAAPQMMLLKPREVRVVTIVFKPTKRMGEFQREMKMLVCGRECPFALVTGACEDSEIHLDVAALKFSDVVVGATATRRLVIMNSGDISQRFTWTGLRHTPGLSVTPQTGFVRSHTECICEFHYTPPRADSALSRGVVVEFDNSPPLSVLVEANGMARTPSKGVLQFRCRARETVVERVTIENVFAQVWSFDPEFDHGAWSGPRAVVVKPRSKVEIAITYAPMRATGVGERDEGTMFIPQPDGNGLTYKLEGIADPPGPAGPVTEMELEVDATGTGRFEVRNWTHTPLRFARELCWTPAPEEGIVSVKGPSWLEVPAESSKEYALSFSSLREGLYRGVVSFSCPERGDLTQYYEVSLHVTGRAIATVVELVAAVRSVASYAIALSNPLAKAVVVQSRVESGGGAGGGVDHVEVAPSVSVPPKSAFPLPVEFMPLVHREYAPVKVTISSPELGSSSYLFKLRSSPAGQEKVTRLSCPLGQSIVFTLAFTHFCKSHADFAIRIGGDEAGGAGKSVLFSKVGQGMSVKVQATTRPRGQEVTTDFVYEPNALGSTREVIEFVSPVGGTYSFPVIASCVAPQRQGPYAMRPGQNTPVPFKNVFLEPVTISIATDSHNFTVARKSEVVAAKKSISIPVQCRIDEGVDVVYGKLIISCTPPGEARAVEWVYYLEGSRPDPVSGGAVRRAPPRKR